LPITQIERALTEIDKQYQEDANVQSIAVAKLTSLISAMFGGDGIAPCEFVPFPHLLKTDEDTGSLDISKSTAEIFFRLVDMGQIPNLILADLAPLLPSWRRKLES
jgi:hypothetical protein